MLASEGFRKPQLSTSKHQVHVASSQHVVGSGCARAAAGASTARRRVKKSGRRSFIAEEVVIREENEKVGGAGGAIAVEVGGAGAVQSDAQSLERIPYRARSTQ